MENINIAKDIIKSELNDLKPYLTKRIATNDEVLSNRYYLLLEYFVWLKDELQILNRYKEKK